MKLDVTKLIRRGLIGLAVIPLLTHVSKADDFYYYSNSDISGFTATEDEDYISLDSYDGYINVWDSSIEGGDDDDYINLYAYDGGVINVEYDVYGDYQSASSDPGRDEIYLSAEWYSTTTVNGTVDGGVGKDMISLNSYFSSSVTADAIQGGEGDDDISVSARYGSNANVYTIQGGAGDDAINIYAYDESTTNVNTIQGGDGDDSINLNADYFATINVTNIQGDAGDDYISLSADYYASINVGGHIRGGDGDDTIGLQAYYNSQINVSEDIEGGAGDDSISLTASDYNAQINLSNDIEGKDGDDTVTLYAQYGGYIGLDEIKGDAGDDTISLTSTGYYGEGETTDSYIYVNTGIEGGDGDDTITLLAENNGELRVDGDIYGDDYYYDYSGDDQISLTSNGSGSNLNVYGSIYGGDGDDTISVRAENGGYAHVNYIYGDDGDDSITLTSTGLGSTVSVYDIDGGYGDDTLSLLASDGGQININYVYGGDGEDQITLTAQGGAFENSVSRIYVNENIGGGDGNDSIALNAEDGGSIDVYNSIYGDYGNDEISLTATGTHYDGEGTFESYIHVYSSIQGGIGNDTITLLAENDGDIYVDGDIFGDNANFDSDYNGNDEISLTANGPGSTVYMYGNTYGEYGDDSINVTAENGGYVYTRTLSGDGGDDSISITSTGGVFESGTVSHVELAGNLSGGDGNDTISLLAENGGYIESDEIAFYGGNGNDEISVTATGYHFDGEGNTNSEIELYTYIYGDSGNDTINLFAENQGEIWNWGSIYGDDYFFEESGNDQISLTATGSGSSIHLYGNVFGGYGDDTISLLAEDGGYVYTYNIYGGDGNDTISVIASGYGEDEDHAQVRISGTIYGENGDDTITLLAEDGGSIDVYGIYGNDGADHISLTATGYDSYINVDDDNVYGGNDNDTISLLALNGGYVELDYGIYGDDGDDTISLTANGTDVDGYSHSRIYVDDSVSGGAGNDTITLLALNGGEVHVDEDINGNDGNDTISLTANGEDFDGNPSEVTVYNIYAGLDNDEISLHALNGGNVFAYSIDAGPGDDVISLHAQSNGTVYVGDGYEFDFYNNDYTAINLGTGQDELTIHAENGGVAVVSGNIVSEDGGDQITLSTYDGEESTGAIMLFGNIEGNGGTDLTLVGGLTSRLNTDVLEDGLQGLVEAVRDTGLILIAGNVNNIDTLTKEAPGLAVILGFNESSMEINNINVDGGSLYLSSYDLQGIEGGLTQITVDGGEELGGAGYWRADVTMNTGVFSAGLLPLNTDLALRLYGEPGFSISDLTVQGSLTFNAGTSIRYDVRPQLNTESPVRGDGAADLIIHESANEGVVTFSSDSYVRLSPTDLNHVVNDGEYVILSSNTNIVGMPGAVSVQFNELVKDTGTYKGSLVPDLVGVQTANVFGTNLARFTTLSKVSNGDGQDLVATIHHDYEGLAGSNTTLASLGKSLDSLIQSEDEEVQDYIASLDYSSYAAFAQLSPEVNVNKSVGMVNTNFRTNRMLDSHFTGVRNRSSNGGIVRQQVAFGADSPMTLGFQPNNSSVWGEISNDWQDYRDSFTNTDYDGTVGAFSAGIDYQVTDTLVLGLMVDGSSSKYSYTNGETKMDSMLVLAYGTWGEATGYYSNFSAGYGNHSMDDSQTTGISSTTDANSLLAYITFGYAMQDGAIKHGPYAGAEYQKMSVDGFNLNGVIIPVTVNGYDVDSLRALIGYRAETKYGKFSPYASIAYAQELNNDNVTTTATVAGSPFTVTTDGPTSAFQVGFGTGYTFSEALTGTIGYRGEVSVDSNGLNSHGFNLGLDWAF